MRLPRDPRVRVGLGLLAALVAFVLVIEVIDRLTPEPKGPRSSSYATSPAGLAAYASVLERAGHPVRQLRTPIASASPADETLIVLDPDVVDAEEAEAIGAWVKGRRAPRGRAGAATSAVARGCDGPGAEWSDGGRGLATGPLGTAVGETVGVREVAVEGGGWRELGGTLPVIGRRTLRSSHRAQRRGDRRADRRSVPPAERAARRWPTMRRSDWGSRAARGGPWRSWRPCTATASRAASAGCRRRSSGCCSGCFSRRSWRCRSVGRRFGPTEDPETEPPPPRMEYVDALAAALARHETRGRRRKRSPSEGGWARPRGGRGAQGRDRPRRGAEGRPLRARARRPRAARGRPGDREDPARERDRAGARARASGACSSRRTCCPHDVTGTMALRGGELVFRPGRCRRPRARGRDQPHAAEDPGGAAGGDAGRPGHRRRRAAPAARSVPRARHPEPGRVRGHLPAARGPARPLPRPRGHRLPGGRGGARDAAARAARSEAGALEDVQRVATAEDLRAAREEVDATEVSDDVVGYVVAVVRRTRELPSVSLGASPRAAVHLLGAAKAAARLAGRGYVTPDDVARMAAPVLRHRLVLTPEAELERATPMGAIRAALEDVPVPR